jgi:O-antigen/teichoic acid export membrane protein
MAKDDTDAGAIPVAAPPRRGDLRRIAGGAAWMVAARWAMRSFGLVSTIVLARLLRPEDFGLVAMGALTVQFVLVFADAGQAMAVIRDADATPEHFDTAWTMSICIGTVVGLVLLGMAPLAGAYFHDGRVVPVIQFLALKPFINGFTNVGILNFRKDLRFAKDFQFQVAQRFSVFIVTIALALFLRNYWALAIGNVCGEILSVGLSYIMHSYRPKLRLSRIRDIYAYSLWMQLANIGTYFGDQADQLTVGGLAGTQSMGLYNVSSDLASAPTNEIVIPTARALFPIYATLVSDSARFAQAYLEVLSSVAVIALSTGIGVALVGHDLVTVVLGAKWTAAAPLVGWLAVGSGVLGVARSANAVLVVSGSGSLLAVRNWLFVSLLVPAVIVGGWSRGTEGIAIARMTVTVLFAPIMFYTVVRTIPVTPWQIVERIWRPAAAALVMAVVVMTAGTDAIAIVILRLLTNVCLGGATFALVLFGLWFIAGMPRGFEATVIDQLGRVWRRARPRRSHG